MQDYKNWKVWERSHHFVLSIYKSTTDFPRDELFGITSQLRRASTSIVLNIVEGSGKNTTKSKIHYLNTAYASAAGVEYLIFLCQELKYFSTSQNNALSNEITVIKKMLYKFIKKLSDDVPNN